MTAGSMAREALEGKRDWREAVREEVSRALSSSPECRALALRAASGEEGFKAVKEGLRASVLSGACGVLSLLLPKADGEWGGAACGKYGGAMRRRSRRVVKLLTLFGPALVERWHWTCAVCGWGSCPLDTGWGWRRAASA